MPDQNGIMVAFMLPPKMADMVSVPGGLESDDIHMTVLWLGDAGDYDMSDITQMAVIIQGWAARTAPMLAEVTGETHFLPKGDDPIPHVLLVSALGLNEARADLVNELKRYGYVSPTRYGYTPHVTRGYFKTKQSFVTPKFTWRLNDVTFKVGEEVISFPLTGVEKHADHDQSSHGNWADGMWADRGFMPDPDATEQGWRSDTVLAFDEEPVVIKYRSGPINLVAAHSPQYGVNSQVWRGLERDGLKPWGGGLLGEGGYASLLDPSGGSFQTLGARSANDRAILFHIKADNALYIFWDHDEPPTWDQASVAFNTALQNHPGPVDAVVFDLSNKVKSHGQIWGSQVAVRKDDLAKFRKYVDIKDIYGHSSTPEEFVDSALTKKAVVLAPKKTFQLVVVDEFDELLSKHYGPGNHDNGTSQDVHGGGDGHHAEHAEDDLSTERHYTKEEVGLIGRVLRRNRSMNREEMLQWMRDEFDQITDKDRERFFQWYFDANKSAAELGDKYGIGLERAASVIAISSPNHKWEKNLLAAERAIQGYFENEDVFKDMDPKAIVDIWKKTTGLPLTGYWKTWLPRAIQVLRGGDIGEWTTGVKVRSFYNNIVNPWDSTSVTVDGWMVIGMNRLFDRKIGMQAITKWIRGRGLKGVGAKSWRAKNGLYNYYASIISDLAKEKGVRPHQIQAALWSFWRENY